jgi:hypothetical protein
LFVTVPLTSNIIIGMLYTYFNIIGRITSLGNRNKIFCSGDNFKMCFEVISYDVDYVYLVQGSDQQIFMNTIVRNSESVAFEYLRDCC